MTLHVSYSRLSDARLTEELTRLAAEERRSTTRLVACLDEFDRRRLYLGYGFPSLFAYCMQALHISEDAACRRIAVARAIRRHPCLLEMLDDGRLSITTAGLLVQRLPPGLVQAVLERAARKSKREVELLIASVQPQPAVPAVVRKLPEPKPASRSTTVPVDETPLTLGELLPTSAPVSPPRRPVVAPLSESQYKLQVTISAAARERLQQIQDLMRHRVPSGDPAVIVEHAFEVLHRKLLKEKAAEVAKPRRGENAGEVKGRHIPASVRRAVWRRDEGRCAFIATDGKRCDSRSGVEFHHVRPFAVGGAATTENIEMRCRAHNGFEWERHLDGQTEALISH